MFENELREHNCETPIDELSKSKDISTDQNSASDTRKSTRALRKNERMTQLNLTIQCTESTRKRWETLQKPYGSQSSFVRNLLLLEKFFRRGDLLLTPNASHNAIAYAEKVQHRLQAYDNILPRPVHISQIWPQSAQTNGTVCKSTEISFVLFEFSTGVKHQFNNFGWITWKFNPIQKKIGKKVQEASCLSPDSCVHFRNLLEFELNWFRMKCFYYKFQFCPPL